ncbi:MAG: sigma-70 family RNA polymerase sigma factor [Planctomycetaceae bacterium]|nr:sigma-70 family RNA polymerase sigma factor [Planctomycetaceae bacterium]
MTDANENRQDDTKEKAPFVKLLTANHARIYAYIISLVPNDSDADDIMQETASLMWENFSKFEPGTNFVSWAVTIAKFQILNYRKRHRQSRTFLSDKAYDLLISETEKLQEEGLDRLHALRDCLRKLSQKDQQFIRLRYYEGASARIVAQKVGTSIDAVYRSGARLNHLLLNCVRRTLTCRG